MSGNFSDLHLARTTNCAGNQRLSPMEVSPRARRKDREEFAFEVISALLVTKEDLL
jgi:hypothetical protein